MATEKSTGYSLMNDGEKLRELVDLALECGAGEAMVIDAAAVLLDPRVRLKCLIPPCYMSGQCGHCPPHGYSLEETRQRLSGYTRGVFFRVPVDSRFIASPLISDALIEHRMDDRSDLWGVGLSYVLVVQIAVLLEKKAGEIGLRATGFTAGDCKDILCFFHSHCMALISEKKGCRHPDLARPSMESCGMDVFTMAARAGWETYPIGGTCRPGDVPQGALMGLVMLGEKRVAGPGLDDSRETASAGEDLSARVAAPPDPPFKSFSHKIKVYGDKHISLKNMLRIALWTRRRAFLRVVKNFRRIEGSWSGALRQMKNVQYL
jgi:predicted metal-binding protein